jgi:hypothetical protein
VPLSSFTLEYETQRNRSQDAAATPRHAKAAAVGVATAVGVLDRQPTKGNTRGR